MSRVTAYTRSQRPLLPGCQELDYWRRIHLPYFQLVQQHVFEQFQQVELEIDQELTPGMLRASEITVLQNWIPLAGEREVFQAAHQMVAPLPAFWIYDLSDPELLELEWVREILPLMNLITVPNEHMQREVGYFLRRGHAPCLVLPSVISQTWLLRSLPQQSRKELGTSLAIGMLGEHDWERFTPGFCAALTPYCEQFAIVTDQECVYRIAQEWQISVCHTCLTASSYANILSKIDVGLVPREGKDGRQTCWASEYNLAMVPVLACDHSAYKDPLLGIAAFLNYNDPSSFVQEILSWTKDEQGKEAYLSAARMGYALAMRNRVSVAAMTYRLRLRGCLPAFCFLS
jgi:hypothetical protein